MNTIVCNLFIVNLRYLFLDTIQNETVIFFLDTENNEIYFLLLQLVK